LVPNSEIESLPGLQTPPQYTFSTGILRYDDSGCGTLFF